MTWKPGQPILDLDQVRCELAHAEPYFDEDSGEWRRSYFLGTVTALSPSGKFYTSWANSNVDDCPLCHGRGTVPNPKPRAKRYAALARQTSRLRAQAMDRYGGWIMGQWPPKLIARLARLERRKDRHGPTTPCRYCHGVGSREAWVDSRWNEQFAEELERIDAYAFEGEGDPCDIFVGRSAEAPRRYTVVAWDKGSQKTAPNGLFPYSQKGLSRAISQALELMKQPNIGEMKIAQVHLLNEDDQFEEDDSRSHIAAEADGTWDPQDVASITNLQHEAQEAA